MKSTEKIYDKNGTLLHKGDVIDTDNCTLEVFWDEWYIDLWSKKTILHIEEFSISSYKDGYCLEDFEKVV